MLWSLANPLETLKCLRRANMMVNIALRTANIAFGLLLHGYPGPFFTPKLPAEADSLASNAELSPEANEMVS